MKYMGSKNRHAKSILDIILKNRTDDMAYIEPFCGGCNVIDKVSGIRIANDSHFYLIEMFKALQDGWVPPLEVSESEYIDIKNNKDNYTPFLVGYVGFNLSYSGKWFGGYRRDSVGKRNYGIESYKNVTKQSTNLKGILFNNVNYLDLEIPKNSIVYCDPPYQGTTQYKDKFDHLKFWNWVRTIQEIAHSVFISEYTAPNDFVCVWEKQVNNSLTKNTGSKGGVEKLFIRRSL